jgi:hypothetical protein
MRYFEVTLEVGFWGVKVGWRGTNMGNGTKLGRTYDTWVFDGLGSFTTLRMSGL